jgi:hypothetical protein
MKRKRRAAPPIDAPAIPPGLNPLDEDGAAEDDCAGGEEDALDGEEVDDD